MRDPDTALDHLSKAHAAISSGDGAKARHHVGHALSALNEKKISGSPKHFIAGAIKHPGALRKALHAKAGQPIPEQTLDDAEDSSDPMLAKRATLAKTLKSFNHKG